MRRAAKIALGADAVHRRGDGRWADAQAYAASAGGAADSVGSDLARASTPDFGSAVALAIIDRYPARYLALPTPGP